MGIPIFVVHNTEDTTYTDFSRCLFDVLRPLLVDVCLMFYGHFCAQGRLYRPSGRQR